MPKLKQSDISPATMGSIRPGTQYVQLSKEEDDLLGGMAKKYGLDKLELMSKLISNATSVASPKLAVSVQSLEKLQALRDKGAIDNSKSNPINDLLQYGLYKDLRNDLKKGDDGRMSAREMMEMNMINMQMLMMQKGITSEGNNQNNEIEKLKIEYDNKLKEMETKHQNEINRLTMERKLEDLQNSILGEIDTLKKKIELQSKIPTLYPSGTAVIKDPVKELEEMGGKMRRIKEALGPFFPAALAPPNTPPAAYKNPDGTTDWVGVIERIGPVVQRTVESFGKKAPEMGEMTNTPPASGSGTQQITERRMTMEEYSEFLLRLPERTAEQQQWLVDYYDHLSREHDKLENVVLYPEGMGDISQAEQIPERRYIQQPYMGQPDGQDVDNPQGEPLEPINDDDIEKPEDDIPQGEGDGQTQEDNPSKPSTMVDKIKEQDEATLRNTKGFV